MSGKADLIEQLTPEQRAAYNYMIGQDQKGLITVFPKPDRELTDSKFINPGHSDQQGIVNTGNNQPLASGPTHTGNSDGLVTTGGTSTVTPLPDGPSKDDLAYLDRPANLSPQGSARAGVFNEAKRQSHASTIELQVLRFPERFSTVKINSLPLNTTPESDFSKRPEIA
ncbi:hypothetical protein [Rosenbergiella nectarea]|uniref:hypothetical protein n=1 Tax=Rosenbergiella nectarea TaxID=988801 RepID=UPI001F4DB4C0|nr:hypothetical protein [Rosenbergiella nectarea]